MLLCRKTFETTENYNSDQIGRQKEQNDELRPKTFKTTQKYESDLNTMTCIDLMSKRSKQRKTTKVIKLRWICIDLTSKRSKMLSYVAKHSKPLNYKSDQNTMTFNDLMSKTSKQRKTTKIIKLHEFHRLYVQMIKTTQNNESDQITMNLHRFDVQTIKNVELRRKPFKTAKLQKWSKYNDFQRFDVKNFKTTQNCKSNEITMNCIDITSKWSKMLLCRKTFETTENYKSDQIGRHNEQNDELRRKTFKTTQNYESDLNTMTCIDLMSKRSIMTSSSKNIQNNAKLQK